MGLFTLSTCCRAAQESKRRDATTTPSKDLLRFYEGFARRTISFQVFTQNYYYVF